MKKSRLLALLFAVMIVASIMSGCTGSSTPTPPTTTTTAPQTDTTTTAPASSTPEATDPTAAYMNPTGLPIALQSTTFTIFTVKDPSIPDWDQMSIWKWMCDQTNVNFVQNSAPDGDSYLEQLNLKIAGGDYPDIIMSCGSFDWLAEEKLIKSGVLVDLTDVSQKWMPNMMDFFASRPDVKADAYASDGKLWTLPMYYSSTGGNPQLVYMDNYWIGATGRTDVPTSVEDLYTWLGQIRNVMDTNGKDSKMYPVGTACGATTGTSSFTGMVNQGFQGVLTNYDSPICFPDNKTLAFNFNLPGYKESIQWLRDAYVNKYINPDCFTLDGPTFSANEFDYDYAIVSSSPSRFDIAKFRGDGVAAFYPLTSKFNSKSFCAYENGFLHTMAAFTDKCKQPEIALRFFDLLYNSNVNAIENPDEITSMTPFLGRYGINWKLSDDKKFWLWIPPEGFADPAAFNFPDADKLWFPGWGTTPGVEIYTPMAKGSQLYEWKQAATAKYVYPYCSTDTQLPANMRLSPAEVEKVNTAYTDLCTYLGTSFAKFVTGDMDLTKDWDSFMTTVKTYDLDTISSVYQAAYDRYTANLK